MRVSRSRLCAAAMAEYLKRHRRQGVRSALDRMYGGRAGKSAMPGSLATMQSLSILNCDW